MRATLALAVALLLCATPGWSELRIPLRITEPAGVARDAAPVTVGVPLPSGRSPDGVLWVADPAGRPVRTQTRVLERWPDGSARWVLLDVVVAAGANETATYTIRGGRAPGEARGNAIKTTESNAEWRLDTGVAEVTIPRSGQSLLGTLRTGKQTPAPLDLITALHIDGKVMRDVPHARGAVETEGPVRTELLLAGRDESNLTFETRVAAFAGVSALRVMLTVTSLSDDPYTRIASLPVTLRGTVSAGAVGLGGGVRRWADLTAPHELRQLDARRVRVDGAPVDGSGDGWVRAVRGTTAVTLVRRYFTEEWPQALRVDGTAVGVDLLDGTDGPVELGMGAAKTFELWIVFEPAADAGDPGRLAAGFRQPLLAHVDPGWTAASRALPNAVVPGGPSAKIVLTRLETAIGRYLARNRAERWDDGPPVPCEERKAEHERIGAYGALNWGDWNFPGYRDRSEGCDAWGNHEYDLPQVLGLAWAATGSRTAWDAFVTHARHYRDVDVLHYGPKFEDWVGINHPHKAKHFAFESSNKFDLGHTWLEGLLTHYRLTGEVRSLEAARGIADVLVRRRHKAQNPRQFGWPMLALAAAYDATRDARYRDAALSYADAAIAHEASPAAGDWKMGILADGVAAVYEVTNEPRLRDWLVRYADAYAAEPARFDDARYASPLGVMARITGNARYRELAIATADGLQLGDWGKTLAISGRTAFRLLGPLGADAKGAATPARAAPPRPSAGERPPRSRSPRATVPRKAD